MSTQSFLVLVVGSVAMSMFLIWQRADVRKMEYECGSLQRQALQLQEENRRLTSETTALKSPQVLELKARAMGLGLQDASASGPAVSEAEPEKKEPTHGTAVASASGARNAAAPVRREEHVGTARGVGLTWAAAPPPAPFGSRP
jgi:cell division protein FtsL